MNFVHLMNRARSENHLYSVLLELTYQCNLKCQFCYNDLEAKGKHLSLDDYRGLLDELAAMGTMGLSFTGGEPLIYPHFFELAAYARNLGFSITVKSNGVTLNQTNAKRLKEEVDPWMVEMSLHGACAATHDSLTAQSGSFDRMLQNIRFMRELGFRMKLNSALTRLNENEIEAMFALADDLGVPLQFDPEVTPRDNGDLAPLLLTASAKGKHNMFRLTAERALRRMTNNDSRTQTVPLRLPQQTPGPTVAGTAVRTKNCGAGSTNLAIDPFGNVYPCVQFRRKVGNVHEQTIRSIWDSSSLLNDVREMAYTAREKAMAHGITNYCMGSAELFTGDPLTIHGAAIENSLISDEVAREVFVTDPA